MQNSPLIFDDVPRYPPFLKGLPTATCEQLLATQLSLIQSIRNGINFSEQQFDDLIMPCLLQFAGFVHLLPASEQHHHCGAGGLLHHSLEVAYWTLMASENQIYEQDTPPSVRKALDMRWRVAAMLSGLCHDIGKVISDISVTDESGQLAWDPFTQSLVEWTLTASVSRYFIYWREGRHKQHETLSILALNRVLPNALLGWLTNGTPNILHAMLIAIGHTEKGHFLSQMVRLADQKSVEKDLKSQRHFGESHQLGVPIEKYVLDTMKRLLIERTWLVNQKDARVWVAQIANEKSTLIVWQAAAREIIQRLSDDNVPGIPKDIDRLAMLLIERGYAKRASVDQLYQKYAPACLIKAGKPVWLKMLQLVHHEYLFDGILPDSTAVYSQSEWDAEKAQYQQNPYTFQQNSLNNNQKNSPKIQIFANTSDLDCYDTKQTQKSEFLGKNDQILSPLTSPVQTNERLISAFNFSENFQNRVKSENSPMPTELATQLSAQTSTSHATTHTELATKKLNTFFSLLHHAGPEQVHTTERGYRIHFDVLKLIGAQAGLQQGELLRTLMNAKLCQIEKGQWFLITPAKF